MTKSEIPPRKHTFFSTLVVFSLIIGLFPTQTALARPERESEPPANGPGTYRLKQWTVEDASAALAEAEKKWENTEPSYPEPKWYTASGNSLMLLEKETLVRFPDDVDRSETYWRLAYEQAFRLEASKSPFTITSGVDWFVIALRNDLNSGLTSLHLIDEQLEKHSFTVLSHLPAKNLLGDQQEATVLQIKIEDKYTPYVLELVVAITKTTPESYTVIPLYDHWVGYQAFTYGAEEETISINDHNGNSIPEIVSKIRVNGRFYCYSLLSLYEWRGGLGVESEFQNITGDIWQVSAIDAECDGKVWSFSQAQIGEAQDIIQNETEYTVGEDCPNYVTRIRYSWSGTVYLRTDSEIEPFEPSNDRKCNITWAIQAGGSNAQSVSMLEEALEKPMGTSFGPATEDYLRFKLGTWYGLQGKVNQARLILEAVRDHPANLNFTMSAEMADRFLSRYEDAGDVFYACKAVAKHVQDQLYKQHSIDYQTLDDEYILDTWGFHEPQWGLIFLPVGGDSICDPEAAFQTSIANLHPSSEAEFINLLRLNQIPVLTVKQVELNGDDKTDWIVIVNSDLQEDWELWPVITQNNKLLAVKNSLFFNSDSYYMNLGRCTINSSEEATVVQMGRHINLFEIAQETAGFHVNNLLDPIYRTLSQID